MVKGQGEKGGIIRDLSKMPTPETGFQGELRCGAEEAKVGENLEVSGVDLPEGKEFQLLWRSYIANWDIERNEDGVLWRRFFGINHRERQEILASVETNSEGGFSVDVEIPEDYGGLHDIYLIDDEKRINKVGVLVVPSFDVSPEAGPLGSPITVTAQGIPLPVADSVDTPPYHIYYDNKYTGLISPVTPRGTAELTIPATGRPGPHVIDVERCQFANAHSYRQTHIGLLSLPGTPDLSWTFEVTDGDPQLPSPVGEQVPQNVARSEVDLSEDKNPQITTSHRVITVDDSLEIFGSGFPAGSKVELIWPELEGSNIREEGFKERTAVKVNATVDTDGKFKTEIKPAPETVQGGPHPIHAMVDGEKVATTSAIVLPVFEELSRKSGPVGSQITINAQGVGWNEIWNQVTILYDNSYIGYACGGDIPGIIEAKLRATGSPGWHFIDIYPTIQKQRKFAEEAFEIPFIYRLPFLNWDSHPAGYHFRYAFKVE